MAIPLGSGSYENALCVDFATLWFRCFLEILACETCERINILLKSSHDLATNDGITNADVAISYS